MNQHVAELSCYCLGENVVENRKYISTFAHNLPSQNSTAHTTGGTALLLQKPKIQLSSMLHLFNLQLHYLHYLHHSPCNINYPIITVRTNGCTQLCLVTTSQHTSSHMLRASLTHHQGAHNCTKHMFNLFCIILYTEPTRCTIFLICLSLFSTCFGHVRAHHQEKIPYLCDTWYQSLYTECNRRNGPDFGREFLRSNYTDITQNTYIQS